MAITVTQINSFGPNTTVTASYAAFRDNALSYVSGDGGGSSDTPGYYNPITSGFINEMVVTKNITNFHYWKGTIEPTGNFIDEYGGNLFIGVFIDGGGTKITLSEVSYSIDWSNYFTDASGDYSASTYSNLRVGLNNDGSGGYTKVESGAATTEVDAILIIRATSTNFNFATDGSGTPQEQLDEVFSGKATFTVDTTFTYDAGGANETIDSGTVTINVPQDYPLSTTTQSYTLTGIDLFFSYGYKILLDSLSYTLTGIASIFNRGIKLLSEAQTYTLTGIDNILNRGIKMLGDVQTYTLTGINSLFSLGKGLAANVALFTLTGVSNTITSARKLATTVQTYTLTGINNILHKVFLPLVANTQTFILTSYDTFFQKVISPLIAVTQQYIITPVDVALRSGKTMVVDFAHFVVTGFNSRGLLNGISTIWGKVSKSSDLWSNANKSKQDFINNDEI